MKVVPFHKNTLDNTHCYQACLRMILGYYLPDKKYSFRDLDTFTGKREGKWTWPTLSLMKFHNLGFIVKHKSTFDIDKFAKDGEKYLIEKYGKVVGEIQIKNSEIEYERGLAKQFTKIFGNKPALPQFDELKIFLSKGYLVGVNLNYYPLYGKKGYSGHFVVILNVSNKYVTIHDPGLPPKANKKIPISNFMAAWEYPTKDSRNYQAFKLDGN